ncbi:MAG: copper ion binding protein, partial [Desulfotomaculales bacterium]
MEHAKRRKISLPVEGMSCAACAARVERLLKETPGVFGAAVNLVTGRAVFEYDPERVSLSDLAEEIRNLGYQVPVQEINLTVRGMSCASCVARVERAISALPGVVQVNVSLPAETARVTLYPGTVTAAEIKEEIRSLGYEASEKT